MKPKTSEIIIAILIILISLGVYTYLFIYADRKVVFLYSHLGSTPFDACTSGRYWMTGFVLSGFLTIFYLIIKLIIKLLSAKDHPRWKTIVKISFLPLLLGILIITMDVGEPKLTFSLSISSAATLIIGLIIGFSIVDDLLNHFKSTKNYLIAGLGLVPFLMLFRTLELPDKGILSWGTSITLTIISIVGGLLWLSFARLLTENDKSPLIKVLTGTLAITYLGFPVLHYLVATPEGIPYITASGNIFAEGMVLRITTWILLILLAFIGEKLSKIFKNI